VQRHASGSQYSVGSLGLRLGISDQRGMKRRKANKALYVGGEVQREGARRPSEESRKNTVRIIKIYIRGGDGGRGMPRGDPGIDGLGNLAFVRQK